MLLNSNIKYLLNRAIVLNNKIKELQELDKELKILKTELNKLVEDGEIKDADGEVLYMWKFVSMTKFDKDSLKEDLPEVYDKYSSVEPCARSYIKVTSEV